jgi:hypothetical protein
MSAAGVPSRESSAIPHTPRRTPELVPAGIELSGVPLGVPNGGKLSDTTRLDRAANIASSREKHRHSDYIECVAQLERV